MKWSTEWRYPVSRPSASVIPRNSIRAESFGSTHTVSFLRSGFVLFRRKPRWVFRAAGTGQIELGACRFSSSIWRKIIANVPGGILKTLLFAGQAPIRGNTIVRFDIAPIWRRRASSASQASRDGPSIIAYCSSALRLGDWACPVLVDGWGLRLRHQV